MRSHKIHDLKQLKEEHCWLLFAKHAFRDENPQINPEFKEIGINIIEKCKGLPLALKTIGSLLYTKSHVLEWKSILTSEIWDLSEEDSDIIPALMLSYHHLPSHLKRCFAYCSLFPKDYEFEKEQLILLWMAENFLQCPRQSKSMKEVGEQYFDDLVSRSFFQQSSGDKMHFVMHDLLNDLARYVCGDFCVRLEVEEAQNMSKMTRHFSFVKYYKDYFEGCAGLYDSNRLRTFLPLSCTQDVSMCWMSNSLMHSLFSKLRFLRVLSLSGYVNVIKLPNTVGNLKHLRYLDLSHTSIKMLPDSICSLYNLQILKLTNCHSLLRLPLNLHKLSNLGYLDFSGTKVIKMPIHFEKLKNLQVLNSFYVEKGNECNIQQLGELNLHGTLSILELQNIVNPLDALAANLKNKIHLVKLELEWRGNDDNLQKEREVLEKLQPSKHLKELSIIEYGSTRFPDWFGENSLSNVVSLMLSNCKNCELLPPLGLLSSLKKLSIEGLDGIMVIGGEFYGNGSSSSTIPFLSLETLNFKDMKGWKEWECNTERGAFPCLRELSIKKCPELKEQLPKQLPCLMSLEISDCQKLVASLPWAPTIHNLHLENYGKLQFDYDPSTLKSLKIGGHCMEGSLLEWIEHTISNTALETLRITNFPTMNFPICHCYNLIVTLDISSSCESLRTFPLDFFPNLLSLKLQYCHNLEMISQEQVHNIEVLKIVWCSKFVSFPRGGLCAPRLWYCEFNELMNLTSLPEHMDILLPSLFQLDIRNCPQLSPFQDGGLPSNLKYLYLLKCSKHFIDSLEWALGTNSSLLHLSIGEVGMESFPDEGLLPLSLTSLSIRSCAFLKKLDYKGLCHLSSLTGLYLADCPNLKCLPEEGLPKSISNLEIRGSCAWLKIRCQKRKGEDWGKITHIKRIQIDHDIIA